MFYASYNAYAFIDEIIFTEIYRYALTKFS